MGADATPGPVASPAAPGGAAGTKPPLDDMMLAMDVVDTLRRRERVAKSELDEAGREADLKERLHKIYADQGLEVSDRIIEQAVAALREERFAYKPPPSSLATRLALLYIRRGVWGKWLAGIAGAGVLGTSLFYFLVVAPKAALPRELTDLHREVAAMAQTPDAQSAVNRVYHAGQAALREDNRAAAKEALAKLGDLRSVLGQEYTLRIVNRPGVMTGVYRIPDVNTGARNYYIVVEGRGPLGPGADRPDPERRDQVRRTGQALGPAGRPAHLQRGRRGQEGRRDRPARPLRLQGGRSPDPRLRPADHRRRHHEVVRRDPWFPADRPWPISTGR